MFYSLGSLHFSFSDIVCPFEINAWLISSPSFPSHLQLSAHLPPAKDYCCFPCCRVTISLVRPSRLTFCQLRIRNMSGIISAFSPGLFLLGIYTDLTSLKCVLRVNEGRRGRNNSGIKHCISFLVSLVYGLYKNRAQSSLFFSPLHLCLLFVPISMSMLLLLVLGYSYFSKAKLIFEILNCTILLNNQKTKHWLNNNVGV